MFYNKDVLILVLHYKSDNKMIDKKAPSKDKKEEINKVLKIIVNLLRIINIIWNLF